MQPHTIIAYLILKMDDPRFIHAFLEHVRPEQACFYFKHIAFKADIYRSRFTALVFPLAEQLLFKDWVAIRGLE